MRDIILTALVVSIGINVCGQDIQVDGDCSEIITIVNPINDDDLDVSDPFIIIINDETVYDPVTQGPVDYVDPYDWDGDGVSNEEEEIYADTDSDNDGIPDYLDTDSDNDGIPDGEDMCRTESGETEYGVTPTGCPPTDDDFDGDGIPNDVEPEGDIDGDGIDNEYDFDSDGDGYPDGGINGDLCPWIQGLNTADGCPENTTPDDLDGDGVPNDLEATCDGNVVGGLSAETSPDSDGDGIGDLADHCPCVYSEAPDGCERTIFWVHGFQGNNTSWAPVADEVGTTWKADSHQDHCIDYSSYQDGSLNDASEKVKSQIQGLADEQTYHKGNIAIAHSLGGMALRNIDIIKDANERELYEGLVTFGTAHHGAGAANAGQDYPYVIENFLSNTCNSLAKPLILDLAKFDEDIGAIDAWAAYKVLDVVSENLCTAGPDFLMDKLIEFNKETVSNDLTTEYMTSLPPMHATHNVVVWGEEDGLTDSQGADLTARLYGSLLNPPSKEAIYSAGDHIDDKGIAAFADMNTMYLERHDELEDDLTWWDNLWNTQHYEIVQDYKSALDWFNEYHYRWMEIIGAANIIDNCQCTSWSIHGPSTTWTETGGNCEDFDLETSIDGSGGVECFDFISFEMELKPNDGFITAESAMTAPGVNYETFLMEGSNHLQMRNDNNTKLAMEFIFNHGAGIENGFFVTERR